MSTVVYLSGRIALSCDGAIQKEEATGRYYGHAPMTASRDGVSVELAAHTWYTEADISAALNASHG